MSESSDNSNNLGVEKQKTLRLLITVGALIFLAVVGSSVIFEGTRENGEGKVDIDVTKGKFSLTLKKPIVEQIKQDKSETKGPGRKIKFTEGIIKDRKVVDEIKDLGAAKPTAFSGKNFISNDLGFLFSVKSPENWQINANSAGLANPLIPVYTIFNREGSHLNIGVDAINPDVDIEQYVAFNIDAMLQSGAIRQEPQVTYDQRSETAFAVFRNPETMGESYQKVIIDRAKNRVFVASANYNQNLSSPDGIQDLLNMITTFTLF